MNIQYIDLYNFKSFKEGCFDAQQYGSGLHLIYGHNTQQPQLGSNGVGKSSLLDAVSFTLYGKTLRGLKSKHIRTWDESGSSNVKVGINDIEVFRQWNPNKLQINDGQWRDIEQTELEDIVGLSFEEFKNSVVFGQFNEFFLDLRPADKLAMLDGIFDTSFWDEKSSQANQFKKEQEQQVSSLESELQRLKENEERSKTKLSQYQEKQKSFQSEVDSEVSELQASYFSTEDELAEIEEDIKSHSKSYEGVCEEVTKLDEAVVGLENDINTKAHERSKKESDYRYAYSRLQDVENKIEKLESLEGGECPECLQEVSSDHAQKHLDKLEREAEELDNELANLEDKFNKLKKEERELNNELEEMKSQLKDKKEESRKIDRELNDLDKKKQSLNSKLERYESEIDNLKNKQNPYIEMVSEIESELENIRDKTSSTEKQIQESKSKVNLYDYWVSGFKEIRSYVISNAISTLELSVNNTLQSLGMDGWKILFDVEKESQSTGNVRRGFYTVIKNPQGEEVAWESYSGGETQRLRLSVMLGISDAIASMKGLDVNTLFIDEPSSFISQEGIQDLMQTLKDYALSHNKSIFVIDHHNLEFPFTSNTLITKDENGSKIAT